MNSNNGVNSNTIIKVNFKVIIILVLFLIGIYFLIPHLVDARDAAKLLLQVNKFYIILAITCEFISYVGAAWLLGIILSRLGSNVNFWDRFRIGSIAAFAIHFFPLGSFGEGAVDYYFLRKRRVPSGSILLTLILRIIFTYLAFFLLFLFALILVPTVKDLSLTPKLISGFIFILVFGGIIYLVYLYENKEKFRRVWQKFFGFSKLFLGKIGKQNLTPERQSAIFDDIYEGLSLYAKKKRNFIFAIIAALVYWLGDILCCYFVFASFGYWIHFGVLTFSYGIGSLVGMISFIPGGLGVTEGSMGLLLAALGVPGSVTLVSILVFRFFSFWIWIPIGLYSYLSLQKKR